MITNLRDITKEVVNALIRNEEKFSVFDVTGEVRAILNPVTTIGIFEVPELRVDNEDYTFEVKHEDVKGIFQDLFVNDEFEAPLNRQFNGRFFEYEGATVQPDASATDKLAAALNALPNATNILAPSSSTTLTGSKLPYTVLNDRVRTYLDNCSVRGVTPTAKQVQSAVKRDNEQVGWTCTELKMLFGLS